MTAPSVGEGLRAPATMGEMFLRAIRRNPPDALAVWDDEERLSFGDLANRVAVACMRLRDAGLQPRDALAQLSRNKCDALVAIVSAFVMGLRYTPLHPMASADDQAFILKDAAIDALIIDETAFAARTDILRAALSSKDVLFSHRGTDSAPGLIDLASRAQMPEHCPAHSDDLALLAYTGGTTGRPKGVMHRHGSLMANLLIVLGEWEWQGRVRFLATTPISHAAFLFVLPVWLRGGSVGLSAAFSPAGFAEQVSREKVTATFLVPTMIHALLESGLSRIDLASLDTIIYGAAPILPDRLAEAISRFGPIFAQLYGQTEAPNAISMLFKRDHVGERLASCGVVLGPNVVALLDDDGNEVALGCTGEICVRGPLVMDGYWHQPAETEEAFANGWLHTGDLAWCDAQGFLYLVDRKKDMIISGGFNVYPREIEDSLARHPGVGQCCVAGIPDAKWGEIVAALVVPSATVNAPALIEHVKSAKGPHQAPKFVHFVEELPITGLGKPDRKAVAAILEKARAAGRLV